MAILRGGHTSLWHQSSGLEWGLVCAELDLLSDKQVELVAARLGLLRGLPYHPTRRQLLGAIERHAYLDELAEAYRRVTGRLL